MRPASTMSKLHGKTAGITGGTIGMALTTAKLFVEEGAHVVVTGRRKDKLDDAVAEIGHNVTGVQGDVSNLDDLDRLVEAVIAHTGRVDVLFASAGNHTFDEPLGAVTERSFDEVFDVNVRGTFFTVQKLLPLMPDGASIILNGSAAAVQGSPGSTVYAASKAALRSFARTWTTDLKERRIRVNVLSPGAIHTPSFETLPPEFRSQALSAIPAGRLGAEADVATVALFLASADSGYITGAELPVDGGLTQV
ncbi:NAD(P)-dependent dehydrogenase (short-subunit alcohol dehydrogenase family) [Pseudonocardia cypriaca]|uniref:NAD(P)-dependent dehydrogenase (Short-subunit alcohol dehydrogenase family) n=2 Tax=Pseudonocardia cypriaca TaxID=882449 RepID=A0A543FVZ2_9PSEU|nr:NAD(P)-dependent dehydrogenase (short-subunit alcohol dehydrogenase family) [Pseudonocardia cypriaca]